WVEKDPDGGWLVSVVFPAGEATVAIHPDGLKLFDDMPITEPTRCLIGARLDSVVKLNDQWRLKLQPDSGVLLTEPRVVERLGLGGDSDAEKIRQRQFNLVNPPR